MLILFVYLVSMNLLVIKTQETIVKIDIKKGGKGTCDVPREVTLVKDTNVSLVIESEYFIQESYWNIKRKDRNLQKLKNSNFSITYERSISSEHKKKHNFIYKYKHTLMVNDKNAGGEWNFTFVLLKNYDPWISNDQSDTETWCCNTIVLINSSSGKSHNNSPSDFDSGLETSRGMGGTVDGAVLTCLIIFVCVFGILLFLQTSYIIYGKVRSCKSKKNNDEDPISPKSPKTKRGTKTTRNIADRPQLPLPPEEVVEEDKFKIKMEPKPSPMSPVPRRHHLFPPATAPPMPVENAYNNHHTGPLVPKQSYRNKGLDNSNEELKSPPGARRPMEGPLIPKQSYRNKGLHHSVEDIRTPALPRRCIDGLVPKPSYRNKPFDSSDEDLRSPGLPRRQMEGPLVPKQSYRNKTLHNSEEELRTPGFARRQIEAKFAQLPPKAVTASKSFKLPKPLPRSPPSPLPEKAPAFHPALRKEPAPPLHPRKLPGPAFSPSAPCRQTEQRLSDVDWQYEELAPASKYLNNFSNTPYSNMEKM